MIRETTHVIPATDGFPLTATTFAPEAEQGGPSVLFSSALAVPRKIYAPFARFLAARGATVVTYDYRGIGESRPERLRGFAATAADWALRDAAGVADHLARTRPGARLLGAGHSFGGQAFGLMPGNDRFERVLTIAAQAGYWRLLVPRERLKIYTALKLLIPAVSRVAGYVPARRYKLGEDIPLGVFMQWRGWCLSPGYYYDDPTLDAASSAARVRASVLAVGLSDDSWATPVAIDRLMEGFTNAQVERRTITPAEAGVAKIGHFALFRADHQKTLWPVLTDWLLAD